MVENLFGYILYIEWDNKYHNNNTMWITQGYFMAMIVVSIVLFYNKLGVNWLWLVINRINKQVCGWLATH